MTTENIKTLITLLGFIPEDKNRNIWAKKYSNYDNYTITTRKNQDKCRNNFVQI